MIDFSAFPINRKWPAQHPDRIQLYSLATPNGVKISIMLEETGLPYEAHYVSFDNNDQLSPEFMSLNPYGKIPAIIDPNGPNGKPLPLFESGAILVYLAAKSGKFLPQDVAGKYEALQWLMFQMSGVGPMFGQVGFFHKFAGKNYEDKRPRDRYCALRPHATYRPRRPVPFASRRRPLVAGRGNGQGVVPRRSRLSATSIGSPEGCGNVPRYRCAPRRPRHRRAAGAG